MPSLSTIVAAFQDLQDDICAALEGLDGQGKFAEDLWSMKSGGGGGRTRIIQGKHIEKGGVNFSHVSGSVSDQLKKILKKDGKEYHATGVSIVLHPVNPFVPIIHMNIRYFEMDSQVWWFGGGIDLTPHYIDSNEASFLHRSLKSVCDGIDANYYDRFKTWADNYFFIRHREETRGVGGIFFDRLDESEGHSKESLFDFVLGVGKKFMPIYEQLFLANWQRSFTENNISWRNYRRGRYVEFNLVWDRGTRFGLETGGRTESILMSLPATANWVYDYQAEPNSDEAFTLNNLKKGIDWLS